MDSKAAMADGGQPPASILAYEGRSVRIGVRTMRLSRWRVAGAPGLPEPLSRPLQTPRYLLGSDQRTAWWQLGFQVRIVVVSVTESSSDLVTTKWFTGVSVESVPLRNVICDHIVTLRGVGRLRHYTRHSSILIPKVTMMVDALDHATTSTKKATTTATMPIEQSSSYLGSSMISYRTLLKALVAIGLVVVASSEAHPHQGKVTPFKAGDPGVSSSLSETADLCYESLISL